MNDQPITDAELDEWERLVDANHITMADAYLHFPRAVAELRNLRAESLEYENFLADVASALGWAKENDGVAFVEQIKKLRATVDKLGVASVDGARFDAEAGWRFSMLMVQCLKHPELYPEHVGKCVAAKVAKFMREKEAARKETK